MGLQSAIEELAAAGGGADREEARVAFEELAHAAELFVACGEKFIRRHVDQFTQALEQVHFEA